MGIVKSRYYIICLKDILKPLCLHYYFSSKQLAKDNLKRLISKKERKWYKVVSGAYLKKYEPRIYKGLKLNIKKYRYPRNDMSAAERKNFRTIQRRRLRRMNLWVKSPGWGKLVNKSKRVKYVKNNQAVANCPTTDARVICLDRRGTHRFYLLEKITKGKRAGDLFRASATCFDIKKKIKKKVTLRIKNIDIVTPFLRSELKKKIEDSGWQISI